MPSSAPMRPPARAANRIQRRPVVPPRKNRLLAIVLGAVLAIYVIVNYVSHQRLRASEKQSAAAGQTSAEKPTASSRGLEPLAAVSETPLAAAPEQPTAAQPEPSAEPKLPPKSDQVLRKEVRLLWEAGNYAEAMRLVDGFLGANPASAEARSWKKKIRAAQEAEAALR